MWAALLTGDAQAQGRGTPGTRSATPRQRFHLEVYLPSEVAEQRIAAVVAAGGTVIDDSEAPSLIVLADQDGNRGVLCVAESPAPTD